MTEFKVLDFPPRIREEKELGTEGGSARSVMRGEGDISAGL